MAQYGLRHTGLQTLQHTVTDRYWGWRDTITYSWHQSARAQPVDSNNRRGGASSYGKQGAFLHASSRAKLKRFELVDDGERLQPPSNPISFVGKHGQEGYFTPYVHFASYDQQREAIARAESLAYERFYRGKRGLLTGASSLGVTLASWRQSRDMIVKRSNDVRKLVTKLAQSIERDPRRKARIRRRLSLDPSAPASSVLEVKFGWQPLFEDLESAMRNVIAAGAIEEIWTYHTGRGKVKYKFDTTRHSSPLPWRWAEISNWETTLSSTYSAMVRVENRNLYLLNRLGLINPASVAWDLIPWSFVVSMFGNFTSLISSITDEVGLEITNEAITNTVKSRRTETQRCRGKSYIAIDYVAFSKHRRLNVRPALRFEARVPELNWDLAVTASALAWQRIMKLNGLLRITHF